jgi:hypothetical protein
MVPFEELQELWQSQPAAIAEPAALRAAELTEAFRRYGRRQSYINVVRLGAVLFQIVWILVKTVRTPLTLCALGLLVLGESVYLFSDWRNQLGIARLNFTGPSLEFVRTSIQRLSEQRNPLRRHFWLLVVTVAGGMNLLALARGQHFTLLERLAYHLTACAAPFAAVVLGLKIRGKRWRYECLPLVERLRAIEHALEERGDDRLRYDEPVGLSHL